MLSIIIKDPGVLTDQSSVKAPERTEKIKVLIADADGQMARHLASFIGQKGFEARVVSNGKDARSMVLEWKPRFVLADLMLSDGNALSLLDFIKSSDLLRHQFIHLIVMSGHNVESNVRQCFERGAKDYLVKPFRVEDALQRLIFHSRGYRKASELNAKDYSKVDEASLMLHLTDLVLRQALGQGNLEDILFNLTRMVNLKVDGVRCSIVNCLDQRSGIVVTSNDDRQASGIQLDLYKYPELVHVMNTRSLVAIENIDESPEMKNIKARAQEISFNSMIVCPVFRKGEFFGALSLRLPPEKQTVTDNQIRFVEIVSHVVSLVLSNEIHKENDNFWLTTVRASIVPFPMRTAKN